jgi:hypothetical protein
MPKCCCFSNRQKRILLNEINKRLSLGRSKKSIAKSLCITTKMIRDWQANEDKIRAAPCDNYFVHCGCPSAVTHLVDQLEKIVDEHNASGNFVDPFTMANITSKLCPE